MGQGGEAFFRHSGGYSSDVGNWKQLKALSKKEEEET
jgi:hypothetical protein